ncbi:hypothetical protein EJ110_NYTH58032 [Nymphaea thermarum]|nr:hypothetical protein EJ110_NYTH58032 [Nymphaea thermarum]
MVVDQGKEPLDFIAMMNGRIESLAKKLSMIPKTFILQGEESSNDSSDEDPCCLDVLPLEERMDEGDSVQASKISQLPSQKKTSQNGDISMKMLFTSLFRRGFSTEYYRCLDEDEANEGLRATHVGKGLNLQYEGNPCRQGVKPAMLAKATNASKGLLRSFLFCLPSTNYKCNKKGHMKAQCWFNPQNKIKGVRHDYKQGGQSSKSTAEDMQQLLMTAFSKMTIKQNEQGEWILDSGAATHVAGNAGFSSSPSERDLKRAARTLEDPTAIYRPVQQFRWIQDVTFLRLFGCNFCFKKKRKLGKRATACIGRAMEAVGFTGNRRKIEREGRQPAITVRSGGWEVYRPGKGRPPATLLSPDGPVRLAGAHPSSPVAFTLPSLLFINRIQDREKGEKIGGFPGGICRLLAGVGPPSPRPISGGTRRRPPTELGGLPVEHHRSPAVRQASGGDDRRAVDLGRVGSGRVRPDPDP